MAKTSYTQQKQKIEREILRLQKQAQALESRQRGPILTSIVRSMREYDITPEEIIQAYNTRSRAGRPAGKTAAKTARKAAGKTVTRTVAPKYRNPETGATWTGRGKAPRWVVDAEAQGTDRTEFLINPPQTS